MRDVSAAQVGLLHCGLLYYFKSRDIIHSFHYLVLLTKQNV